MHGARAFGHEAEDEGPVQHAERRADPHRGREALLRQRRAQHGPQHEAQGDAARAVAQANGPVLQIDKSLHEVPLIFR